MVLHPRRPVRQFAADHGLRFAALLTVVAIALMVLASAIFGVHVSGPSYEIVPDPAGVAIPF
jgi:hypothetical protein